jgi:hypothetical protein
MASPDQGAQHRDPLAHVSEKWEPVSDKDMRQSNEPRGHSDSTQSGRALTRSILR